MAVVKPDAYQFAIEALRRELEAVKDQLEEVVRHARRRYRRSELPLEELEDDELEDDPFLEEEED